MFRFLIITMKLVLERRLELLNLTVHAPKACAYTNSATPAKKSELFKIS